MTHIRFQTFLAAAVSVMLCGALFAGCGSRDGSTSSSSSSSMSSSSSPSSSSRPESSSSMPSSSSDMESGSRSSGSSSGSSSDSLSDSSMEEPSAAAAGSADLAQIAALDGSPVTGGPGKDFGADGRPTAPVSLQKQYEEYGAVFIGGADKKTVYLTFDQGYENGYTEKILDTLKEKQVPAVFFLTGHYVNTAPELIQRMKDEGHVLGNHSNKHLDPTETPLANVLQDLNELHDMVQDQFGYDCRLYRCPEGKFSEQTLALAQQNAYTPVFWSFAYADWDVNNQMDPADALRQLCDRLHNGAIYLLHSVSSTNAAVLGDFIDAARGQGYEFQALEPTGGTNRAGN